MMLNETGALSWQRRAIGLILFIILCGIMVYNNRHSKTQVTITISYLLISILLFLLN